MLEPVSGSSRAPVGGNRHNGLIKGFVALSTGSLENVPAFPDAYRMLQWHTVTMNPYAKGIG